MRESLPLAIAAVCCILGFGWLALALAALIVTFTLSWRPRLLAPLAMWIRPVPSVGAGASS